MDVSAQSDPDYPPQTSFSVRLDSTILNPAECREFHASAPKENRLPAISSTSHQSHIIKNSCEASSGAQSFDEEKGENEETDNDEEESIWATSPSKIASSHPNATVTSAPLAIISISIYFSVSLAIVYFNWWLFTQSFKFPVFVSWIQQIVGLLIYSALGAVGERFIPYLRRFRPFLPQPSVAVRVLPLSLAFVGMVGLANICLKFVLVSTYQVARSLTIFFTIILSYAFLGETQNCCILAACTLMVVGFIIGSFDRNALSFLGLAAGASSSIFQAFYNVIIKRTLVHVDNDPTVLLYYNLWLSSFLFIPVIFIAGEISVFHQLVFSLKDPRFATQWGSLFFSGFLATAMNLASYWCVKATSPLTFNIVGFTKSIVQSLGGIIFLGDEYSIQSLSGIILSFMGSGWYSGVKVGFIQWPCFHARDRDTSKELSEMSLRSAMSSGNECNAASQTRVGRFNACQCCPFSAVDLTFYSAVSYEKHSPIDASVPVPRGYYEGRADRRYRWSALRSLLAALSTARAATLTFLEGKVFRRPLRHQYEILERTNEMVPVAKDQIINLKELWDNRKFGGRSTVSTAESYVADLNEESLLHNEVLGVVTHRNHQIDLATAADPMGSAFPSLSNQKAPQSDGDMSRLAKRSLSSTDLRSSESINSPIAHVSWNANNGVFWPVEPPVSMRTISICLELEK